ncbi:glycosyl hydrolase family 88 [Niabella ginsenosidivorans]|uniref:Glycosyl hydrolase family 88 n=1 Tax=Niabella ginsenosidivorans TaxID=1176587 RepID=A0A1A9HZY4_9BACT|nr:glycoside hydrolase family 88 protein [Niabella ginsenosidivorans]ANH80967.1 glycosyl hydrolase family 88 [Niabella ginsenosidivorans]
MKKKLILFIALAVSLIGDTACKTDEKKWVDENFKYAVTQLKGMLQATEHARGQFPRTTDKTGKPVNTDMYDWTSGFFPGNLWYLYEYSRNAAIEKEAVRWTEKLESLQTFTQHHDLGFMMYCSYGNAYRITGNETYKNVLVQAARSLSTRFNPVTGAIKSWNRFASWHGNKTYSYPVIIDNMMNLELLYFASKVTGDSSFSHIATAHALTAMKNQVREDYSHYHVVCYDSLTGKVEARETAQGYADNSTWARGQAWGVYGFTMVYRETHDPRFLKTATGMADFFINNKRLPEDKIPYWDFDALQKGYAPGIKSYANKVNTLYRDASAAAITASALLELAMYVPDRKTQYINTAIAMLNALSSPAYRAPIGANGHFLLMHSVGSIPHHTEIDVPLVYADYYFLEALTRYNRLLTTGSPL